MMMGALLSKKDRKEYLLRLKTYLKGGFFALADWPRLLMNGEEIRRSLKRAGGG
jgi:hypothetical protein